MTWPDYGLWAHVGYWALVGLVVAGLLRAWLRRRRLSSGVRYPTRFRIDGVRRGWRARLVQLPFLLRVVALALAVVALSRPQQTSAETAEVEGIDIVIALDLSGSMESVDMPHEALVKLLNAERVPDNRFKNAIEVIRNFIGSRQYDRVSLVGFGKDAYLMFPLTLDYGVMLRILDRMTLGDIDGSRTAIGNALAMSLARLKDSEAKTRLVILLTDGEDNGSNVSPTEMAKAAAERGIHVFTILVGTEDQSYQPRGVDLFTGRPDYVKTNSQVNPKLLEDIAAMTGGVFYRAVDKESLEHDFRDILDRFEKSRLVDLAAAERTEIFHWFLLPAIALLMLEVLLSQTLLRRFP